MEAIKSYFSKILSPNPVMRKGSGKWKKERSAEIARFGKIPHRSASTSQVDLDCHDQDMFAISMGSMRMFTPTLETFKSPQQMSRLQCSSRDGLQHGRHDITRTPPPSKPPRRDLVFSIQLDTEGLNDIGVEIDCLPSSTASVRKNKSSEPDSASNKHLSEETDEGCCSASTTSGQEDSSASSSSRSHALTFKVVALTQGSRCNLDGRVNVNDEIVDINGESLQKETRESGRLLLENAIKSGHVVLTIRRRRKRATEPPAVPTRQTSVLQSSHRIRSASSDDLLVTESNFSPNIHFGDLNSRTRSLDDSVLPDATSLEDSSVDLDISSDDVFADLTTPYEQVTYVNLPNLRFHKKSHIQNAEILPDLLGSNKLDQSDNTSSASEDLSSISSKVSDASSRQESFSPRDEANTHRGGSSTSTLVEESDSKIENCSSSREESADFVKQRKIKGKHRFNQSNSSSKKTVLDPGSSQNVQNMSASVHEGDVRMPNSPLCKKRMVSTMNIMKDKGGLGIHIAGGKGCKKGDIGIFVAAITSGGAADRDGRLKKGDELLMINGKTLIGMTHKEAVDALKKSDQLVKLVVASKVKKSQSAAQPSQKFTESAKTNAQQQFTEQPKDSRSKLKPLQLKKIDKIPISLSKLSSHYSPVSDVPTSRKQARDSKIYNGSSSCGASPSTEFPPIKGQSPCGNIMKWEELFEKFQPVKDGTVLPSSAQLTRPMNITVIKGAAGKGLGFCVVGGSDSLKRDKRIIVKKIYRHGVIALDGHLREGDEIMALNNQSLSGMTHKAVMSLFRSLKQGPVKFTFRPRTVHPATSPESLSETSSLESNDGSPVSTPNHSPYTSPRTSLGDINFVTRDAQFVQKLKNPVSSSNMSQESHLNGISSKYINNNTQHNITKNEMDSTKVKYINNASKKQGLQRESLLPPMPKSSPKPGDQGRIGVVTPISNQHREISNVNHESMGQINPCQNKGLIISSKPVIKSQDRGYNQKVVLPNKVDKKANWTVDSLKLQHQAELAEILKNCTESSPPLQPYTVVSSPKSSSVVKMQVKPVETHLAQSSPVMNLHSFKPAGIAVKYSPSEKEVGNNKQILNSLSVKPHQQNVKENEKIINSERKNNEECVRAPFVKDISSEHQKAESPIVRPKINHATQNAQKSVERVDQQLRENRKQIDISSPVTSQRRNCHSTLTPSRNLNEVHTEKFTSHSKTLPRFHHQNSTEGCHHQTFNSTTLYQQPANHEEKIIKDQTKVNVSTSAVQKNSEISLTGSCYSSLPRGLNHHHLYSQSIDNHRISSSQTNKQQDYDSYDHIDNIGSGRDTSHPIARQVSKTEKLLQDLMKPAYGAQFSMAPFNEAAALSLFDHSHAFTRLSSAPNSLSSVDNNSPFSNFNSSMPAFNQQKDIPISPSTSIKSYSQASYYNYHSQQVKSSFQTNSVSDKQAHSTYDSSQNYNNSGNASIPNAANTNQAPQNMFPLFKMPQMLSSKNLTESAYGHLSGHSKNSQTIISANEKMQWEQNLNKRQKFEVTINKGTF